MTAPGRMRVAAAALSPSDRATNLRPSPVISATSPSASTALTCGRRGLRHDRRRRGRRRRPCPRTPAPAPLRARPASSGQADVGLGPAVAVPMVVVDHAAPHRSIGGFLVGLADRRLDGQALGVGVLAVGVEDDLPRHFGDELRVGRQRLAQALADGERRGLRFPELLGTDVLQIVHSPQYIQLAGFRTFRVADRVVGRRRFGQAGEHRGLGRREVLAAACRSRSARPPRSRRRAARGRSG